MASSSALPDPSSDERVCFNCRYRLWGVALGIGVLCTHENNRVEGRLFAIPSRRHGCRYFESRPIDEPE